MVTKKSENTNNLNAGMTERQKAIYTSTTVGNGLFVFGIVILILFILNASFLLVAGKDSRALALILCACWVIGVPIFFFIEHAFFFRKWGAARAH